MTVCPSGVGLERFSCSCPIRFRVIVTIACVQMKIGTKIITFFNKEEEEHFDKLDLINIILLALW